MKEGAVNLREGTVELSLPGQQRVRVGLNLCGFTAQTTSSDRLT